MKKARVGMVAVMALSLLSGAWAGQEADGPARMRLVLGLVDGSRIIGVPDVTSIRARTPYGDVDVALDLVEDIVRAKGNRMRITLFNGDVLIGRIAPDSSVTVSPEIGISCMVN